MACLQESKAVLCQFKRTSVPASTLRFYEEKGRLRIDRQMLAAKAKELDRTIRKLSAMRDSLRHAAACPEPSHMECPTFRLG